MNKKVNLIKHHKLKRKKWEIVSGVMNEIDLHGYVKRYPKFGRVPILFMQNYADNAQAALEGVLKEGFDIVLVDSWAEVNDLVQEENGWTRRKAESWLLDLLDEHNKANNKTNRHPAFI